MLKYEREIPRSVPLSRRNLLENAIGGGGGEIVGERRTNDPRDYSPIETLTLNYNDGVSSSGGRANIAS